jgi:hypothetical protein
MAAGQPPPGARRSCRFTPVVAAVAFVTVAFVTPGLAVVLLRDGGPRKRSQ